MLAAGFTGAGSVSFAAMDTGPFTDGVLRVLARSIRYEGGTRANFELHWYDAVEPHVINDTEYEYSTYIAFFYPPGGGEVQRIATPVGGETVTLPLLNGGTTIGPEWHVIEISTFGSEYQVWIDGQRVGLFEDPNPIPAGIVSINAWVEEEGASFLFDDIRVCALAAPFETLPPVEEDSGWANL